MFEEVKNEKLIDLVEEHEVIENSIDFAENEEYFKYIRFKLGFEFTLSDLQEVESYIKQKYGADKIKYQFIVSQDEFGRDREYLDAIFKQTRIQLEKEKQELEVRISEEVNKEFEKVLVGQEYTLRKVLSNSRSPFLRKTLFDLIEKQENPQNIYKKLL